MAYMAMFSRGQDPQTERQSTVSKIHGEQAADEKGGTIWSRSKLPVPRSEWNAAAGSVGTKLHKMIFNVNQCMETSMYVNH